MRGARGRHLAISVEEMERELHFYCHLLSFEKDWEMNPCREKIYRPGP